MAFTKITNQELNSRGATTLPNQPKISATALKQEFDAPAKNIVAPKVNNLIDELEATTAAASLGAVAPTGREGETIQALITAISNALAVIEATYPEVAQEAHSHSNKSLLDTYTQNDTDIADAVTKKHSHSNKSLLDTYDQTNSNIADAVTKKHSHDNKACLDKMSDVNGAPYYNGVPFAGSGDMMQTVYDSDQTVANANGIKGYVNSYVGTNAMATDGANCASRVHFPENHSLVVGRELYEGTFGNNSIAAGFQVEMGNDAIAVGEGVSALGDYSAAFGRWTKAPQDAQFVCGKFNEGKQNTYFEIGHGHGTSLRENIFEVYENGDIWYKGKDLNYLEDDSVVLSTSGTTTVTFTDARITTDSYIEYACSQWDLVPDDITVTTGSCVITMPQVDTAVTVGVRIYVR